MSKELKNFKLTNKGGYPMNVVACIEGYRMDKNPEDIINDLMKTEEGTLEGDKGYIERIEDCINSFPVNLNNYEDRKPTYWFPMNCYFIEAFIAYFKEGDTIENMMNGTVYTENMMIAMLTKVIEILSLDFYSDIIFDSINSSYTLDNSIIGLDKRFSNSLMRYRDNSHPNGIRTLGEIVNLVNLIPEPNLKDSIHEAFKDVRGIGDVYEASLEALYMLYMKYIQVKISENNMDEAYKEVIDRLYTKYLQMKNSSEEDKIEYCRRRVKMYDIIGYLKDISTEIDTIHLAINIGNECRAQESLDTNELLKALQMYYNSTYKEDK